MLIEPFEACLPVIELFGEIGVDSYVGGSFASSFHGTPRSTNDVDLVADLRLAHVPLIVEGLKDRYYIDSNQVLEAVRRRGSFNILYLRTMFKVDIFVLGEGSFDRAAMRRRQRIHLGDEAAPVDIASAEDSVLRKLLWYRLGNEVSERQWNDVLGVLKTQGPNLDLEYLARWSGSSKWKSFGAGWRRRRVCVSKFRRARQAGIRPNVSLLPRPDVPIRALVHGIWGP